MYARAEGDDLDLFRDTRAFWSGRRPGHEGSVKRYPTSDAVLNSFANIACRAGDKAAYNRLRISVGTRYSSSAWSSKYLIKDCDRRIGSGGEYHALGSLGEILGRVTSLARAGIGMTRSELLAAKGKPIRQTDTYWVYNTVDARHHGVVTVVFSPAREPTGGRVLAVAYSGDEASAPAELPYLNELSSVEVLQAYGRQIGGNLTLHGEMTFTFRNGIFVNTRDEVVYRYGIFGDPYQANVDSVRVARMKSEQKIVAIGAASGVILMSATVWILTKIRNTRHHGHARGASGIRPAGQCFRGVASLTTGQSALSCSRYAATAYMNLGMIGYNVLFRIFVA